MELKSLTAEQLPEIPAGLDAWDGETAADSVTAKWWNPAITPDGPELCLYQGVIGQTLIAEDGAECLAVDLAAAYLVADGWTITAEDDGKDWREITLTPPVFCNWCYGRQPAPLPLCPICGWQWWRQGDRDKGRLIKHPARIFSPAGREAQG